MRKRRRPNDLEQVLREALDAQLFCRALAELEHHLADLLLHLRDDFLDARRLDAAVLEQFLHREFGDVAARQVEAREDDRARCVINNDVNARGLFKRDDVTAFLTDDLALHVLARQLHHGRGRLAAHLGRVPLHGLGHQVLRLLLDPFLHLFLFQADLSGEVLGEFLLEFIPELLLRLILAQFGDFLQCLAVLSRGDGNFLFVGIQFALRLFQAAALPLDFLHFAVQCALFLLQTTLLLLELRFQFGRVKLGLAQNFPCVGLRLGLSRLDLIPRLVRLRFDLRQLSFLFIDLRLECHRNLLPFREEEPAGCQPGDHAAEQRKDNEGVHGSGGKDPPCASVDDHVSSPKRSGLSARERRPKACSQRNLMINANEVHGRMYESSLPFTLLGARPPYTATEKGGCSIGVWNIRDWLQEEEIAACRPLIFSSPSLQADAGGK